MIDKLEFVGKLDCATRGSLFEKSSAKAFPDF